MLCCTDVNIIQWFLSSYDKHPVFRDLTDRFVPWTTDNHHRELNHSQSRVTFTSVRGKLLETTSRKGANRIKSARCFRLERSKTCSRLQGDEEDPIPEQIRLLVPTPRADCPTTRRVTRVPLFHHIPPPSSSRSPCTHPGKSPSPAFTFLPSLAHHKPDRRRSVRRHFLLLSSCTCTFYCTRRDRARCHSGPEQRSLLPSPAAVTPDGDAFRTT